MNSSEAIKSLQNIIEYWTYRPTEVEAAKLAIEALRQMQERTGRWEFVGYGKPDAWDCSVCGAMVKYQYNYCPHCGAHMSSEGENNAI